METNQFQYCCGAEEISGFYGTSSEIKARIKAYLDQQLDFIKDYEADGDMGEIAGAYIATTIPSQRPAITALRALKFKEVFTFVNPGTGNKVTLWAKKLRRN